MEKEQIVFAQRLEQLKDTARLQKNVLTEEQVQDTFEDMILVNEQFDLIADSFDLLVKGDSSNFMNKMALSRKDK